MKIETRVGLIQADDNRFLGRSVCEELYPTVTDLGELWGRALGLTFADPLDREALRLCALATTSPDARVWPLKLSRLLASAGEPVAGYVGAQLLNSSRLMGPGVGRGCAEALCFVADREEALGLEGALLAWKERSGGRMMGFGVPLRPTDERLRALWGWVEASPLSARPWWQRGLRVAEVGRRVFGAEPNIALGLAALMLDAGLPADRCGLAIGLFTGPAFLAHAIEAAATDGALRELSSAWIDDRCAPARARGEALRDPPPPAFRRAPPPWGAGLDGAGPGAPTPGSGASAARSP